LADSTRTATALACYALCGSFLYALIYDRMDIILGTLLICGVAALLSRAPYCLAFAVLATAVQ